MKLKIRLWDNENGYMIESEQGVYGGLRHALGLSRQTGFSACDNQAKKEKFIAMLFTGMLDKNSIEIWEGDLVIFEYGKFMGVEDDTIEQSVKCKVAYSEREACFSIFPIEISEFEGYPLFVLQDELTVIGNIYENKL